MYPRYRTPPRRGAAPAARDRGPVAGRAPVVVTGLKIATSFWGKAWCDAMESYRDYESRLARGRTYVRRGAVVDLRVQPGEVTALVQGSELYHTSLHVVPLPPAKWRTVVEQHASAIGSLVDLLQGKLPASLLRALSDRSSGLFPGPKEITFDCSCPDWASMCKHVAAVIYGVGARLDVDPSLFFVLRGVEVSDLAARGAVASFEGAGVDDLVDADLSSLFGIELGEDGAGGVPGTEAKGKPAPVKAEVAGKAAVKARAVQAEAKGAKVKVKRARRPSVLTLAQLQAMGIGADLAETWVREGVLGESGRPGVYEVGPLTGQRVLERIAATSTE